MRKQQWRIECGGGAAAVSRSVLQARLDVSDAATSGRKTTSAGTTAGEAASCGELSNDCSPDWQWARHRFGALGSSPFI